MKQLILSAFFATSLFAVTCATARYDNTRNGVNNSETVLTPASLANLKNVGYYTLDNATFGQPLYIPSVTIGGTAYNVLIVASMGNTVYAFNADKPGSAALWSVNFGTNWQTTIFANFYGIYIGILSTPVVDVTNGYVYVVTVNNTPTYTLRQINLSTGVQAASSTISGSSGGVTFTPTYENQRASLTLANGNVYVGFGAGNEPSNWNGWIFAFSTSTMSQVAVINLAPGNGAGVWEAGGPAVDSNGYLYALTGNGVYDGTSNFAQSVVKLSSTLSILDWFTPSNESSTSAADADVASGTVMLIPGTTLLTFGSKDGRVWVIDTTNMGHLQGSGALPQVFAVQSITPGAGTGTYGGMFFQSTGYFPMAGLQTSAFSFSGSTYTTTAAASTVASYGQVMMTGTSNGGANPIVWAITVDSSPFQTEQMGTLRAWNPSTLAEYWNSGTFGHYAKFSAPTIANGKVYVPTLDSSVIVYSLVTTAQTSGPVTLQGNASIQ